MQLGIIARVFGIVYLLVGALGFVPALNQTVPDSSAHLVVGQTTFLLGFFAVNILHNVVHILIGLAGLVLGGSVGGARGYFRLLAVVYGLLVILGLIPLTNTVFGLVPIFGYDVWLHAVTAVLALYLGWGYPVPQEATA